MKIYFYREIYVFLVRKEKEKLFYFLKNLENIFLLLIEISVFSLFFCFVWGYELGGGVRFR